MVSEVAGKHSNHFQLSLLSLWYVLFWREYDESIVVERSFHPESWYIRRHSSSLQFVLSPNKVEANIWKKTKSIVCLMDTMPCMAHEIVRFQIKWIRAVTDIRFCSRQNSSITHHKFNSETWNVKRLATVGSWWILHPLRTMQISHVSHIQTRQIQSNFKSG